MADNHPQDLTNGARINIGDALSCFNAKEYHHIFPRSFLVKKGFKFDEINWLVNICFQPSASNKKISNKQPSEYFAGVIPKEIEMKSSIFATNLLPNMDDTYARDLYYEFADARDRLIYEAAMQKTDEVAEDIGGG